MIKIVYKILPVFIIYTDKLSAAVFGGTSKFCFIKIRPRYKDDIGLLNHELTHVKQFYRLSLLHGILVRFSKKYRLKIELEAYKNQLLSYPVEDRERKILYFAKFMSERYDIDKTVDECYKLLKKEIKNNE